MLFNGLGRFIGRIDERLCTCYPVIAGVCNAGPRPNCELQLARSFHSAAPMLLHFQRSFYVTGAEFCDLGFAACPA